VISQSAVGLPESPAELVLAAWADLLRIESACRKDGCGPDCPVRASVATSALAETRWYAGAEA
jgi:hypothetical protein